MGKKNIVINGKPYQNVSNIKVRDVNGQDMHDFRNTDDATIESKDIPVGKVGYGKDGIVIGTAIQTSGEIDGGINFYDQYGAWLTSYSLSDLPLSALPEIPALEGAGADQYEFAWSMTLEEVNALTEEADIGVDVTAKEGAKTYLIPNEFGFLAGKTYTIYLHGRGTASNVLIDWGDGATTTASLSAISPTQYQHKYNTPSYNPIVLESLSGVYFELGSSGNSSTFFSPSDSIKEYRLGGHLGISQFSGISVEKVLLNNTITNIGTFNAFYRLKALNIPKSIKNILYSLTSDCFSLENIYLHEGLEGSAAIAIEAYSLKKIIFPNTYKELTSTQLLNRCSNLKTLKFPMTPVKIANSNTIVQYCESLEKVINISSCIVESLGSSCMSNNHGLKEFEVPDGVKTIGDYFCRYGYSLKSIIIPESVESIGASPFSNSYSLKQIIMKGKVPPVVSSIGSAALNAILYVPKGSITAYATATNWSKFAEGRMVEY